MDIIELTPESTATELATAFGIRIAKNRAEIIERVKTEWHDHYHTDEIRYLLHALVEELDSQENSEIRTAKAYNAADREDENWERLEGSILQIRVAIARNAGEAQIERTTAEQKERAAKKTKLIRSRHSTKRN